MPPLKVDVHAHLYSREYLAELDRIFANPQTPRECATHATLQGKIKKDSAMWNADERLEFLDELDVQYQILSLSVPQAYEGTQADRLKLARISNDDFANTVSKHPKRFLGFGSLPLPYIDDSLKELERCLDELGMVGVCLGTNVDANWLDDPRLQRRCDLRRRAPRPPRARLEPLNALVQVAPSVAVIARARNPMPGTKLGDWLTAPLCLEQQLQLQLLHRDHPQRHLRLPLPSLSLTEPRLTSDPAGIALSQMCRERLGSPRNRCRRSLANDLLQMSQVLTSRYSPAVLSSFSAPSQVRAGSWSRQRRKERS